ncbi:hypothetical protein B0H14DRAFT_3490803 [Mycena olivaceomarginata]|nr:hypothetical protein B0H14DRAFT_3490803 [Mycena olivaceomarginata]
MFTSDPNTILPPCKFRTKHTLHGVSSTDANWFIIRVHLNTGHGKRRITHTTPVPAHNSQSSQASHITQYKDGTWREPTKFISGSYSLAYVLFEALRRQRNAWNRSGKSEILISIIDLAEVPNDKWLATELVGAYWTHAAFFARWAQEVLIYGHIPSCAVVATMSVNSFFDCLPRWCQSIRKDIHSHSLKSTEDVVDQLKILAKENNMLEEEDVLLVHSIESSLATLRNQSASEDAIDRVSRFAAIFCWWPKWIMGTDPSAYSPLLEDIRGKVRRRYTIMFGEGYNRVEGNESSPMDIDGW